MPRPEDELEIETPAEDVTAEVVEQVQDTTPEVESIVPETPVEQKPAWYQTLGLNDVPDESAALERLRHQLSERDRQAEEIRQYQYHLHQANQRQQAPPPPPAEKPKWEVPDYDPGWADMLERNADGVLVSKNGADPTLPQKFLAYQRGFQEFQNRLYKDPDSFLNERYEASLQGKVQELIQSQMQEYHTKMAVNAWEAQNQALMYQSDASGNRSLTPVGQRIMQYVVAERQVGVTDPVQALNRAIQRVHYDALTSAPVQQAPVAPIKTPQQVNQEKKVEALRTAAARKPSRGASPSETISAPAPRRTFRDLARENFDAAGIGLQDTIA